MIRVLRDLPPAEKRAVVALFNPGALQDPSGHVIPDEDLWAVLVKVLKEDVLRVKLDADLPGALRGRLVEVAQTRLGITPATDEMTDLELALAIVDFVLRVAEWAEEDDDLSKNLAVFFRTRPETLTEVAGSLASAQRAIEAAAKSAADTGSGSLYERIASGASDGEWEEITREAGNVPSTVRLIQMAAASTAGAAALTGVGATAASGGLMAGSAAMAGGAALLFPPVALAALGVGAGVGAGMLWRKRSSSRPRASADPAKGGASGGGPVAQDEKARLARARSSKMVQNVTRLCFAVVGQVGSEGRARVVVLRYLSALCIDFKEAADGTIEVPYGSAVVAISSEELYGRSLVTLTSEVYRGRKPSARLFETLLRLNQDPRVRPGRFAWDPKTQSIEVNYQLLGDSLDIDELAFALRRVGRLADAADDILEEEMGAE